MWFIYCIMDASGRPIYVGATNDPKRRMKEHRPNFMTDITMKILEHGCDEEKRDFAEANWISSFPPGSLLNKAGYTNCGRRSHCESTRKLLSAAAKGKKRPPEVGVKMSLATKGKPHDWSPEGWERSKATRFKKGHIPTHHGIVAMRAISPEKRSLAASKANRTRWANMTPERRSEIIAKIEATKKRNRESTLR